MTDETRRYFEKYTKKELVKNWFSYHKWWLLAGAAALVFLTVTVVKIVTQAEPDYQVAYVGEYNLPDSTVSALESALAAFGEDLNGDGRVLIQLNQYTGFGDDNPMSQMAGETRLVSDFLQGDSGLFLLSDPDSFQQGYDILADQDGMAPESGRAGTELVLRWTDCPVLAGLELGSYDDNILGQAVSGENQALFQDLYVGRRIWEAGSGSQDWEDYDALWNRLTEGAAR